MKLNHGKPQNALFIYTRDDSGRFWVYDGIQYHHFFMDPKSFWYVRSQAYLPAYCVGSCAAFDAKERLIMEAEVAPYGITLPFFSTEEDCFKFAQLAQHAQVIYDHISPAGFFYIDNDLQKR